MPREQARHSRSSKAVYKVVLPMPRSDVFDKAKAGNQCEILEKTQHWRAPKWIVLLEVIELGVNCAAFAWL